MNRIFLKLSSKELSTRYCVLIKNNFSSCITRNEHTCVLHVAYLEQKIYPQVIYRKLQEVRINSFKKQLGITLLLITQLVFFSHEIVADTRLNQLIEDSKQTLSETWDSSDYELYLPVNIWHNRHFYTKEKIDEYNEDPWGFGLGKYRYDTGGDWHAIYGMAFLDSHNKPQLAAGYAY